MIRRPLVLVFALLLVLALIVPAAQGATQVRQVQADLPLPVPGTPITIKSGGTLTLDFVFKNTRRNKNRFTPRLLTRIDLSKVELTCTDHMTFTNKLFLTQTFDTAVRVTKVPHPHPKPGRYAFRFAYGFPGFTGSLTGTIDKVNGEPKPRLARAHGILNIQDFDADPGHPNCATSGPMGWSDLSLTTL